MGIRKLFLFKSVCRFLLCTVVIFWSHQGTVVLTKSDSDVILCLQLLSKTLTCTLHLS